MMSLILLPQLANWQASLNDREERLILTGITWEQYDKLLQAFGDSATYRTIYLEGILEIMSPSRRHEVSKENIGRLLDVYLEAAEIDFWGLGSTTFRVEEGEAGKEPDKCYCFETEKEFPDLAIEVIVTSGSIKILEVYQRLGVKEVWLWKNEQLNIYYLENNQYSLQEKSKLLPDLDLNLLCEFINHPNPRLAMKEFRQQLQAKDG
ncbi:Uma2 family endonuclease [Crocosphaera sp. XPORK-15E]|uniref:Uma2 family endonuclease n=1 Tax=Crocosphaera sp. XPORK-15E TaxID=3110247 RepID=UPI002B20229D|nr:Uma2 family endonuclease [Crocosphaera sp. XPORK-15E]MEA5533638.1 Uma2 family endonuclease [Crocosphaera sp. XPORK-15E]